MILQDLHIESAKATPAAGLFCSWFMNIPLEKWALIVPMVYYIVLLGFLLRDKLRNKDGPKVSDAADSGTGSSASDGSDPPV